MTLIFILYFYSGFFFFKQKTAYEMRISDWSSDVCSSDLRGTCGWITSFLRISAERGLASQPVPTLPVLKTHDLSCGASAASASLPATTPTKAGLLRERFLWETDLRKTDPGTPGL